MITLYNRNNMAVDTSQIKSNLVYADMIYDDADFSSWITKYWETLVDNGVFILQTDDSTMAETKIFMNNLPNAYFINTCIYKQEWGGAPKKGFPKKHDYIHIFSKGKDFKWFGDKIQIKKKTAGSHLDKNNKSMKTPCSVFDDLGNFSTIAKERIKNIDGKNIQWQKPLNLMRRIMLPFLETGDLVVDPFMGSGTTAICCLENGWNFIGIENNREVFDIAEKRIKDFVKDK